MKNKTLTGHLAAFITILIWGTTFISTKVLLRSFSPIEILFIRFVIGYLALWCACPKSFKPADRKQEGYFVLAGLLGVTLYYLFENIALTYTLASNVGVIISIAPFFTVIFTCVFLREGRPGARFFCGFLIAMAGMTGGIRALLCHVELCRENTGLGQNDYLYLYGACHYGRHLGADSAREDDEGDDVRNLFNIIRPVFIRGQEKERKN